MRRYPLGVLLFQQLSKSFFLGIGCICFLCFSYFGKIWVLHSFFGCDSLVLVGRRREIQIYIYINIRNFKFEYEGIKWILGEREKESKKKDLAKCNRKNPGREVFTWSIMSI